MPTPMFSQHPEHAASLVRSAIAAADPADALERAWPAELRSASRVHVLAIGKASVSLARRASQLLGPALHAGVVLAPPAYAGPARGALGSTFSVYETDHPLPTARNEEAARQVAQFAADLTDADTLLALVSGGASAQLTLPAEGVSIADVAAITEFLLKAGATIHELNTVRKHAEQLKGGGLARLARPAHVITRVASDVIGDDLGVVSSGPTAPDPTTFDEALDVLDRYAARRVAPGVTARLIRGTRGEAQETVKPDDPLWRNNDLRVIASNATMIEAVARHASELGFDVVEARSGVEGEAAALGRDLARRAIALQAVADRPSAILLGGEATVTVGEAPGLGGRNQELAAASALELQGAVGISVLALATDGVDGPTDAAGALVHTGTAANATDIGVSLEAALHAHDTHPLLDRLNALVRTGPTGVNLIDLYAALIYPKPVGSGSGE
ncbi:MAG: DUF4147 domain-containing protein [Planctomycetota bacterium]